VLVVPAGVTGLGELVEVGLAGQPWAEGCWGVWVCHAAGSNSGKPLVAGGVGTGSELPTGSGPGQDVQSKVATAFSPFVVLFGQDSSNEADDGVSAGEDADNVCAPADFAV
jgi:hypothetical protein